METRKYTYITVISSTPQLTPNYKHILSYSRIIENDTSIRTLNTIYEPNKPGLDCNFVMHTDTVINIPNFGPSCFANFRLGALKGRCDTIVSGINVVKMGRLKVYPNPNYGQLTIEFDSPALRTIHLYNSLGQRVFSIRTNRQTQNLDVSNMQINAGLFLLEAIDEENNDVLKSKIIYEK